MLLHAAVVRNNRTRNLFIKMQKATRQKLIAMKWDSALPHFFFPVLRQMFRLSFAKNANKFLLGGQSVKNTI